MAFGLMRGAPLRRVGRAAWLWIGLALLADTALAAPLRLAVAPLIYSSPVLIAAAQGYFKDEGLALEVKPCAVGRLCLAQLLAGEADFATVADVPIMLASFSRRDFDILATTTLASRDHQMVVRTDRGIRTPADLRGKRIGVIPGTSSQYFADSYLLFHGIKPDAVTEVALDPQDATGPIVRGEVDAVALFSPPVTEALQKLGPQGRVLEGPVVYSVSFNIVSRSGAQGVGDEDALKFLRAVQRAMDLIQSDPERARNLVAPMLKLPRDEFDKAWDSFEFRLQLTQSLVTTLESQARWALRRDMVQAPKVPDYLGLVRVGPLQRLAPRAMRIVK